MTYIVVLKFCGLIELATLKEIVLESVKGVNARLRICV